MTETRDIRGHYAFRERLAERLCADLLGPATGPTEVLDQEPATAYITGVLYPMHRDPEDARIERDGQDLDLAPARLTQDEVPDTGVAMANRKMPSAMGITFAVDPKRASAVTVTATAAVYEPIDENDRLVAALRASRGGTDEDHTLRWRRRPLSIEPVQVEIDHAREERRELVEGLGLELRVTVRGADENGDVAVTTTLVNARTAARGELLDAQCFFQPVIRIEVPQGSGALVERRRSNGGDERERLLNDLLYRHAPMFAAGHGCAADWDWTPPPAGGVHGHRRATTDAVWTTFTPSAEVLSSQSNPDVPEPGMLWLARAPKPDVIAFLKEIVSGYEEWIRQRSSEAEALRETEFFDIARQQLDSCAVACRRMQGGIARLEEAPDVYEAFQLANEAMAHQRARTAWVRRGRSGEPALGGGRWRPFQIGFILLCLDGIVDLDHPDRDVADLLWFPTGGGKTEAYLGLIALTTFLRRLRDPRAGGGVTVLMRYTLRLLTLQQFERAATLICAMETIRRDRPSSLGTEHISIGMWVGKAATPNWLSAAASSLAELRRNKKLQVENPVQLRSCPWCGTAMDAHDYEVDQDKRRMWIRCRNAECEFHSELPVHVVDEEIYRVRPTLVIATADKFAQIAWREQVCTLFNKADGTHVETSPPELVIQDELHLISGPLGTLAGLYETAIDIAAQRPKVIASTATIRRAQEQGARLFDRGVEQFPPAGLDARDSWFAVEAARDDKASRRYVGLLSASTSQATLLIRSYAALLHYAKQLDGDDDVRDAYWTLVGYFNSLRLLSAAELQVYADVQERLAQLSKREGCEQRTVEILRELTSRVDSSDVPEYLQELFRDFASRSAADVVLATNMISVGVDVDRLGLMAVMGQPQTTAEYIQATSRVGRRDPGLVVTLLNSARSRDRSHYENFISYHSALYQQVESTSVTPFAPRARDRALHAVLVGSARLTLPAARPNLAAARVEEFVADLENLKQEILERVKAIAADEHVETEEELDEFISGWRELARANPRLRYEAVRKKWSGHQRQADEALLSAYGWDEDLYESAPTMWSLRDVDVESDLYLEN
ncbi:DNA helicase [Actinomadura logoneensis]|uniref:DNA helicase n=1 Tax=Actinomadura logoneensis TaxID=2293572 RepID=A0A372JRC9_9ACTN|nr:helicase-related protein [Actinomadura logoneensis]RFU42346.1 DNA helicase [Actinomadura logoneensis]